MVLHFHEEEYCSSSSGGGSSSNSNSSRSSSSSGGGNLVRRAKSCSKDKFRLNCSKSGNVLAEIRTPTTEGWKYLINIKLLKTSFTIATADQVLSHGHLLVPLDGGPRYFNPYCENPTSTYKQGNCPDTVDGGACMMSFLKLP